MFRDEVFKAQKTRLQGQVILTQALPLRAVVIALVLCVTIVIVYLQQGSYTRKQSVRGYIRPQMHVISI